MLNCLLLTPTGSDCSQCQYGHDSYRAGRSCLKTRSPFFFFFFLRETGARRNSHFIINLIRTWHKNQIILTRSFLVFLFTHHQSPIHKVMQDWEQTTEKQCEKMVCSARIFFKFNTWNNNQSLSVANEVLLSGHTLVYIALCFTAVGCNCLPQYWTNF